MSFILDALRKSEHERQRQAGPGLAEATVAAPRGRTNTWATAAIVLFVLNLFVVGVLLMRRAQDAATTDSPANVSPAPSGPAVVESQPTAAASEPRPVVASQPSELPPMLRPAEPEPVAPATRNPLQEEVSDLPPPIDVHTMPDAARVPTGPPAVTRAPTGGGSVIYETLPEADPVTSASHAVPAPERRELPTADEMLAGGVPELRLELHVFSNLPAERFAFINSRKYREGDTLQEGPRVDEITRDGVVLDFRGRRFLLPRE